MMRLIFDHDESTSCSHIVCANPDCGKILPIRHMSVLADNAPLVPSVAYCSNRCVNADSDRMSQLWALSNGIQQELFDPESLRDYSQMGTFS